MLRSAIVTKDGLRILDHQQCHAETATWAGFVFEVIPIGPNPPDWLWAWTGPGIYIMATCTERGTWGLVYLGQACDLRRRIRYHDRWREAREYAFSHLHLLRWPDSGLDELERMLIGHYGTHLNKQHNFFGRHVGLYPGPPSGRPGIVDARSVVRDWLVELDMRRRLSMS